MRTLARILVNAVLLGAALATIAVLRTQPSYLHASHHAQTIMLVVVAGVFFGIAVIVLWAIPTRKQEEKRKSPSGGRRGSSYAAPARRR